MPVATGAASARLPERTPPMPAPTAGERPSAFADRVGVWCVSRRSASCRKAQGLYLTPVPVAHFMAAQIDHLPSGAVRLLDPAAGAGVLCCAAVERLVAATRVASIELVVYESDVALCAALRTVLSHLRDWCGTRHVALRARIRCTDFVAANASALRSLGELLPAAPADSGFDAVIANPPYFKIGRNDPRALAASSIVHGQPNIYALFMAVGAAALRPSGRLAYIVPRSFASGPYFRRFRATFFDFVQPVAVHAFDSRRSAFNRDNVLQENVILAGRRRDGWLAGDGEADGSCAVAISASRGVADLGQPQRRRAPMAAVLNPKDPHRVLRLPLSDADASVLALVESWPCTLGDLGLSVSTGPVVPFRAGSAVCASGNVPATHAPLLWMNHVRPMRASWPLRGHKKEYIRREGTEQLLVPSRNYVLLRRFSAKEERRRLTAAPYVAGRFDVACLGLENHLNYVHRPRGSLSEDECWGLAALYNSGLLDRYFRCVSGNTQVSATELRAMPLPSGDVITALGSRVKRMADPLPVLEDTVMRMVVPKAQREVALGQHSALLASAGEGEGPRGETPALAPAHPLDRREVQPRTPQYRRVRETVRLDAR